MDSVAEGCERDDGNDLFTHTVFFESGTLQSYVYGFSPTGTVYFRPRKAASIVKLI